MKDDVISVAVMAGYPEGCPECGCKGMGIRIAGVWARRVWCLGCTWFKWWPR